MQSSPFVTTPTRRTMANSAVRTARAYLAERYEESRRVLASRSKSKPKTLGEAVRQLKDMVNEINSPEHSCPLRHRQMRVITILQALAESLLGEQPIKADFLHQLAQQFLHLGSTAQTIRIPTQAAQGAQNEIVETIKPLRSGRGRSRLADDLNRLSAEFDAFLQLDHRLAHHLAQTHAEVHTENQTLKHEVQAQQQTILRLEATLRTQAQSTPANTEQPQRTQAALESAQQRIRDLEAELAASEASRVSDIRTLRADSQKSPSSTSAERREISSLKVELATSALELDSARKKLAETEVQLARYSEGLARQRALLQKMRPMMEELKALRAASQASSELTLSATSPSSPSLDR